MWTARIYGTGCGTMYLVTYMVHLVHQWAWPFVQLTCSWQPFIGLVQQRQHYAMVEQPHARFTATPIFQWGVVCHQRRQWAGGGYHLVWDLVLDWQHKVPFPARQVGVIPGAAAMVQSKARKMRMLLPPWCTHHEVWRANGSQWYARLQRWVVGKFSKSRWGVQVGPTAQQLSSTNC